MNILMKKTWKDILICCVVLLLSGCARKSVQNVNTQGTTPGNTGKDFAVLCYNIHHANPPSKPDFIDLQAIANVIKSQQPDVVSLQEVDVNTIRSGKNINQANELARMTGMTAYFAKAIDYQGGEYGVAILSKLPMEQMKNTPLPGVPGTNGEPRTLATAIVTLPSNKKILFAVTHLDAQSNSANRVVQINKIVELLNPETLPVVIAGDFNAVPGSEVINTLDQHFTRTCITGCGFTVPVINPNKTIDFIAYKPAAAVSVVEHKVIDEQYASDHLPVKAVLNIK